MLPLEIEALPGVHIGHRVIPIERVGCYVPGGRFPLLSAPIMTIVPAKVAGVDEVIACLPPNAHEAMVAGCHLSGADRIFRIGGAQAIAAMAYGTETRAGGGQDRRTRQRLRQRGQAAGVRAGGHRPAGGAVGDLRAGRLDRRRRDDRHRPPGAGRARRAHARRAHHDRPGLGRGGAGRGGAAACGPLDRPRSPAPPGRAMARSRWRRRGGDDRLFGP